MKTSKRIVIMLLGLIISTAGAAMLISDSTNPNAFYDVGFVCDYIDMSYCNQVQEGGYSDKNGRIHVEGNSYHIVLGSVKKVKKANYLYINIKDVNKDKIDLIVEFFKGTDTTVPERVVKQYQVKEGNNCLDISGEKFKTMVIWVNDQPETVFTLKKVQAREEKEIFSAKVYLGYMAVILLGYALICTLLGVLSRHLKLSFNFDLYFLIDTLQDIYINIGNSLYEFIPGWVRRWKSQITTALFVFMFVYMTVIDNAKLYIRYFKYHMALYVLILLAIGVLNCGSHLRKINWRTILVISWLIFWGFVCASDFKVTKTHQFIGYIGILVIGFAIFVINNDKKQIILNSFKKAVHISFLIGLLFAVLFRPVMEGFRYLGFSWNPSIMAICLTTALAVILGEFDDYMLQKLSKKRMIFHVFECGSVLMLIIMSQSMGPMISVGFIGLFWIIRCRQYISKRYNMVAFVKLCFAIGIGIIVGGAATYWGIRIIPLAVNHNITMERDMFQAYVDYGLVLDAKAGSIGNLIKNSRIYDKIAGGSLTNLLSTRNYYYMGYIRQMNLWGHKGGANVFATEKLPHNAFLAIAYRYGVFTVIPYIMMLLYTLKYTFRKIFTNEKNCFLAFSICFTSILMSMADNVERPFMWVTWIGLYLMMGVAFPKTQGNN